MNTTSGLRAELVVALDVPSVGEISGILDRLPSEIQWFKVGLELFIADGQRAIDLLVRRGRRVFLDLKLHDIPRTVERAVVSASRLGAEMLTVHAGGGREMLMAAMAGAAASSSRPLIVGVTVLTSLVDQDLAAMGITRGAREQALELARLAVSCGLDGVVCSPIETAEVRAAIGKVPMIVTPGIRPAGTSAGDQKRIATPLAAVEAGATFLVVGRPILEAENMEQAAREILNEMGGD